MNADANRNREIGIDDAAQREQHALLVVAGDAGRAGRQDQLAAVGIDVGGEERDLVLLRRRLHDVHKVDGAPRRSRQARSRSIIASVPSKWTNAIVTGRCSERSAAGKDVRAHGGGQAIARASPRASSAAAPAATSPRMPGGSRRRSIPAPRASPTHELGRNAAVSGLTMISPATAQCSNCDEAAPRGADREELEMGRAHREEMEASRMHALRHSQRDLGTGNFDPADVAQRAAHQDRRAAGARGVTIALEPQKQGIAAELEQAAAVLVGDGQDRLETASDRLGDLFGALAALAREPLGQFRESGDVHEYGGAVARSSIGWPDRRPDVAGECAPHTERPDPRWRPASADSRPRDAWLDRRGRRPTVVMRFGRSSGCRRASCGIRVGPCPDYNLVFASVTVRVAMRTPA